MDFCSLGPFALVPWLPLRLYLRTGRCPRTPSDGINGLAGALGTINGGRGRGGLGGGCARCLTGGIRAWGIVEILVRVLGESARHRACGGSGGETVTGPGEGAGGLIIFWLLSKRIIGLVLKLLLLWQDYIFLPEHDEIDVRF